MARVRIKTGSHTHEYREVPDHNSHPKQNPCGCKGSVSDSVPTVTSDFPYKASICLPHWDTLEQLQLALELWRYQTVKPYMLVIDTGSPDELIPRLLLLRAPDCEVHFQQRGPFRHPSCNVSVALDFAHALCRTLFLFHTHTDVFPKRRDFLEWMINQTGAFCPVVGWRMSPRGKGNWQDCVSHTATMIHMPSSRRHGLAWSLEDYIDHHPEDALGRDGWPDTESGFAWRMKLAGVIPRFLGEELNWQLNETEWFTHVRSYTGLKKIGNQEGWERVRKEWLQVEQESRKRIEQWRVTSSG